MCTYLTMHLFYILQARLMWYFTANFLLQDNEVLFKSVPFFRSCLFLPCNCYNVNTNILPDFVMKMSQRTSQQTFCINLHLTVKVTIDLTFQTIKTFLIGIKLSQSSCQSLMQTGVWTLQLLILLSIKYTFMIFWELFCVCVWLIDDRLYSAILRSLEQTHCARMWFYMSD